MLCLIYSITAINPIERILRKSGYKTRWRFERGGAGAFLSEWRPPGGTS